MESRSRSTVVLHVRNPRKAKLLLPRTHYHNALLFSRLPLVYILGTAAAAAARNHGKATLFQLTPKPAIDLFCYWFLRCFSRRRDLAPGRQYKMRREREDSLRAVAAPLLWSSDCRGKQQQAGVTGAGGRAAAAVEPEQVAALHSFVTQP